MAFRIRFFTYGTVGRSFRLFWMPRLSLAIAPAWSSTRLYVAFLISSRPRLRTFSSSSWAFSWSRTSSFASSLSASSNRRRCSSRVCAITSIRWCCRAICCRTAPPRVAKPTAYPPGPGEAPCGVCGAGDPANRDDVVGNGDPGVSTIGCAAGPGGPYRLPMTFWTSPFRPCSAACSSVIRPSTRATSLAASPPAAARSCRASASRTRSLTAWSLCRNSRSPSCSSPPSAFRPAPTARSSSSAAAAPGPGAAGARAARSSSCTRCRSASTSAASALEAAMFTISSLSRSAWNWSCDTVVSPLKVAAFSNARVTWRL